MFNIKKTFLNKGQTEDGKGGDLVGKERGVAAVDSTRVEKGFAKGGRGLGFVCCRVCVCLRIWGCCVKMCYIQKNLTESYQLLSKTNDLF